MIQYTLSITGCKADTGFKVPLGNRLLSTLTALPPALFIQVCKVLSCQRGGFIADIFSGAPDPINGQPLLPINQQNASQDYQRLQQAVALSGQQASQSQAGGQQGQQAQQQLLAMLGQQAQGGGPNPAQQSLANATGQNVANQAALMAAQRGTSANAGLAGRQIAQQGAQIQQQDAGQAALLRLQQMLGAQQNLGQLGGQLVGQQQAATGQFNAAAAQPGQQLNQQNSNSISNASQMSGAEQQGYASSTGLLGSLASTGAKAMTPVKAARGGEIPGKAKVAGDSEENDVVPTLLSPGEIVIPRSFASDPKAAAAFAHAISMMHSSRKKD